MITVDPLVLLTALAFLVPWAAVRPPGGPDVDEHPRRRRRRSYQPPAQEDPLMTATKASLAVDEETQAHLRSKPLEGGRGLHDTLELDRRAAKNLRTRAARLQEDIASAASPPARSPTAATAARPRRPPAARSPGRSPTRGRAASSPWPGPPASSASSPAAPLSSPPPASPRLATLACSTSSPSPPDQEDRPCPTT